MEQRMSCQQSQRYNQLLEHDLRYRREGPRETFQELGQAVLTAYPELPEEAQDRLARTHFTEAIEDQSVREGVFRSKPTSLDEAILGALATYISTDWRSKGPEGDLSSPGSWKGIHQQK